MKQNEKEKENKIDSEISQNSNINQIGQDNQNNQNDTKSTELNSQITEQPSIQHHIQPIIIKKGKKNKRKDNETNKETKTVAFELKEQNVQNNDLLTSPSFNLQSPSNLLDSQTSLFNLSPSPSNSFTNTSQYNLKTHSTISSSSSLKIGSIHGNKTHSSILSPQSEIINQNNNQTNIALQNATNEISALRNDLREIREMMAITTSTIASAAPSPFTNYNINELTNLRIPTFKIPFSISANLQVGNRNEFSHESKQRMNNYIQQSPILQILPPLTLSYSFLPLLPLKMKIKFEEQKNKINKLFEIQNKENDQQLENREEIIEQTQDNRPVQLLHDQEIQSSSFQLFRMRKIMIPILETSLIVDHNSPSFLFIAKALLQISPQTGLEYQNRDYCNNQNIQQLGISSNSYYQPMNHSNENLATQLIYSRFPPEGIHLLIRITVPLNTLDQLTNINKNENENQLNTANNNFSSNTQSFPHPYIVLSCYALFQNPINNQNEQQQQSQFQQFKIGIMNRNENFNQMIDQQQQQNNLKSPNIQLDQNNINSNHFNAPYICTPLILWQSYIPLSSLIERTGRIDTQIGLNEGLSENQKQIQNQQLQKDNKNNEQNQINSSQSMPQINKFHQFPIQFPVSVVSSSLLTLITFNDGSHTLFHTFSGRLASLPMSMSQCAQIKIIDIGLINNQENAIVYEQKNNATINNKNHNKQFESSSNILRFGGSYLIITSTNGEMTLFFVPFPLFLHKFHLFQNNNQLQNSQLAIQDIHNQKGDYTNQKIVKIFQTNISDPVQNMMYRRNNFQSCFIEQPEDNFEKDESYEKNDINKYIQQKNYNEINNQSLVNDKNENKFGNEHKRRRLDLDDDDEDEEEEIQMVQRNNKQNSDSSMKQSNNISNEKHNVETENLNKHRTEEDIYERSDVSMVPVKRKRNNDELLRDNQYQVIIPSSVLISDIDIIAAPIKESNSQLSSQTIKYPNSFSMKLLLTLSTSQFSSQQFIFSQESNIWHSFPSPQTQYPFQTNSKLSPNQIFQQNNNLSLLPSSSLLPFATLASLVQFNPELTNKSDNTQLQSQHQFQTQQQIQSSTQQQIPTVYQSTQSISSIPLSESYSSFSSSILHSFLNLIPIADSFSLSSESLFGQQKRFYSYSSSSSQSIGTTYGNHNIANNTTNPFISDQTHQNSSFMSSLIGAEGDYAQLWEIEVEMCKDELFHLNSECDLQKQKDQFQGCYPSSLIQRYQHILQRMGSLGITRLQQLNLVKEEYQQSNTASENN